MRLTQSLRRFLQRRNAGASLPWGALEIFIFVTYVLNGVLLFPGAQSIRLAVRALPYAYSLAMLLLFSQRRRSGKLPPGGLLLVLSIFLLLLNLTNPQTQLASGFAQILFQVAIAAPLIWASKQRLDARRLTRIVWLIFLSNALSSTVGILQVYYPERFMPAEFNRGAATEWVSSQSYTTTKGNAIVRPPGLSDMPGGACIAGANAALLGLGLSSRRKQHIFLRLFCTLLAGLGIAIIYLTQVRSILLVAMGGMALMIYFASRQGKLWNQAWIGGASVCVVIGSFAYAVSLGGDAVSERFLRLKDEGVVSSYKSQRGSFLQYTFDEVIPRYPLGAGPGRWGICSLYWGDRQRPDSPLLYAEIQLTGWVYDGGIPLVILYGAALLTSLGFAYRLALSQRYGPAVPQMAGILFCISTSVVIGSFSGPAFNGLLGMQFWLAAAVLYGAARVEWQGPSAEQARKMQERMGLRAASERREIAAQHSSVLSS